MKRLKNLLNQLGKNRLWVSYLLVYLAALFLYHPDFLPNLSEINPWDESAYLHSGQILLDQGDWPDFASNPLTSFFYALTYFPFRSSVFWMPLSAGLGRFFLFSLLWWSALAIAHQLRSWARPEIMAGLLLVTPLVTSMLHFPSDPLYAGLAGLSLWQLLKYLQRLVEGSPASWKNLAAASTWMGLAALARNDGLIHFCLFFVLASIASIVNLWNRHKTLSWRKLLIHLAAAGLPFLILVGGYVGLYGAATGNYSLGTGERAYDNFEAGHQVIYNDASTTNPVFAAKREAQRVFGTGAENNYSILRAVQRNPGVYFQRLAQALRQLPNQVLEAYGQRFAVLLFFLGLYGLIQIIRRRQWLLLLILMAWPLHLVSGLAITLFRSGHLQFPFYIVFSLAGIGLTTLLQDCVQVDHLSETASADARSHKTGWYAWLFVLLILSAVTFVANKLAVYYGAAIFLLALWLIRSLIRHWNPDSAPGHTAIASLLILLCAGLILHGNFPSPKIPMLGVDPRERALVVITERYLPGTPMAAGSPGLAWAARMTFFEIISSRTPLFTSYDELDRWLRAEGVDTILVDGTLSYSNPALWGLIEPEIHRKLERVAQIDDGNIQILRLRDSTLP